MLTFDKRTIRMWSRLGACGALGVAAEELAERDDRLVIATADLCVYSGLQRFRKHYGDRLYNLGIAEQNLMGVAAGMASEGCNVFATTYASFAATRCSDQVKVNMGYMQLPVRLVGLTAGLSAGLLGATHMSCSDLAIMRSIPNLTILSPADCTETVKAILAAAQHQGPVYIRLTGGMPNPVIYPSDYRYEIGRGISLKEGTDLAIIATGSMVYRAQQAMELLEQDAISCGLFDMHTIKPLDTELLDQIVQEYQMIVTVEEHSLIGGLGSAICEYLSDKKQLPIKRIGVPDWYCHAGDYEYLMEQNGLTAQGVYRAISDFERGTRNGI